MKMENNQEVLKIREHYIEKEMTDMDILRALDRKVRKPADVFAYLFGTVSALVMGTGMSLIMTDMGTTLGLSSPMMPGLVIGLAGMGMAICNYPIWKGILSVRRKKYADQVIALSNKISAQSDM